MQGQRPVSPKGIGHQFAGIKRRNSGDADPYEMAKRMAPNRWEHDFILVIFSRNNVENHLKFKKTILARNIAEDFFWVLVWNLIWNLTWKQVPKRSYLNS